MELRIVMTILATPNNGPMIIGLALIALVGAIVITAILKYDADSVLKILGALGTVIGFIVGGMGTYFFTREQVAQKDLQFRAAQTALYAIQNEKAQLGHDVVSWAGFAKAAGTTDEREKAVLRLQEIGMALLKATPSPRPPNEKNGTIFYPPKATPPPPSPDEKDETIFRPLIQPNATASPN